MRVSNKTAGKTSYLDARDLKARVDLVVFAGQVTQLRRSGRQFLGLCPLHSERHPSFYVHPHKQVFKCFGCGAGGDVFALVMKVEGCGFLDALRIVAEFSHGGSQRQRAGCEAARERFAAGVGAAHAAAKQQHAYSQDNSRTQDSRDRILAALHATNRRLRTIEATNLSAAESLRTACEPERSPFTCQKPDNSP